LVLVLEGESLAKVVVLGGVEQNVLQVLVCHDALQILCVLRACVRWRVVGRDRVLQGERGRGQVVIEVGIFGDGTGKSEAAKERERGRGGVS